MHRLPPRCCGRSAYQVRPPSTRIGSVTRERSPSETGFAGLRPPPCSPGKPPRFPGRQKPSQFRSVSEACRGLRTEFRPFSRILRLKSPASLCLQNSVSRTREAAMEGRLPRPAVRWRPIARTRASGEQPSYQASKASRPSKLAICGDRHPLALPDRLGGWRRLADRRSSGAERSRRS